MPQMAVVRCIHPAPNYNFASFKLLLSEIIARVDKVNECLFSLSHHLLSQQKFLLSLSYFNLSTKTDIPLIWTLRVACESFWVIHTGQICSIPTYSTVPTYIEAHYSPGSFKRLTLSEEWGVCTLHPSLIESQIHRTSFSSIWMLKIFCWHHLHKFPRFMTR